ncbi:MAG: multiheme c-type cytochrome, partial [Longimicrobiales bacterium]
MQRSLWGALLFLASVACDVEPEPFPGAVVGREPVVRADFAGAEACATCHEAAYEAWSASTHGTAGGPPSDETVIAPFGGQALMFRDARVTPVRQGLSWRFDVVWAGDTVSHEVAGVIGRGHMAGGGTQGFVTPWPDGTVRFLPFDWSESERTWFCNTEGRLNAGWVPVSDSLSLTSCSDWPPRRVIGSQARFPGCQGCHGSQISVEFDADSGYHTEWTSLRVECEACHGPAAEHVAWATDDPDPGGNPQIPSLAALRTDESLDVCAACHTLKAQLDHGFLTGAPNLEDHFSAGFAILAQAPYTPDGRPATFAYQGTHRSSACYLSGNMSCTSCHEPHGQGYWDVNRDRLMSALDDRQCTACHGAKAADPGAHTLHQAGTEGARCVSCHMPYLQQPAVGEEIAYGRADHTVSIPRPLFDASAGVDGACQGCHSEWTPSQIAASIEAGWGRVKPPRTLVDQIVADGRGLPLNRAAAARVWLRPDLKDPIAQFTTLARFLVLFVEPGDPLEPAVSDRLWELAES